MADWLEARDIDILCLQEVRAPDDVVHDLLGGSWHVVHAEAADKGRAGVAIASKLQPTASRPHIGDEYFATAGRWVESDFAVPTSTGGTTTFTVASAYVHSGEAGTAKQEDKYRFLDAMTARLPQLQAASDHALVVGDFNVGHTERDIKNWKGNLKKSGFLPDEREYFDRFFGDIGWADVARRLAGDVDGPYTWWSWRGKAFDNDTGWRIDYHMATETLADSAVDAVVDRASAYDQRFSDHAPLVVDYRF